MKSPILQVLYESKANLDENFLLGNNIHKGMLKEIIKILVSIFQILVLRNIA